MTKYTCVLIEEDRLVASLVGFRLKRLLYDVHHLRNTNLKSMKNINADIVLISLHSNSLNIIEVLSEIRTIIGSNTPLVVIHSSSRQRLLIENNKIQIEGFLSSPIDLSDLENTIAQLIGEKYNKTDIVS